MRNLLLDSYIQLSDAQDPGQYSELVLMAYQSTLQGNDAKVINKAQRYACLRKLIAAGHDIGELLKIEFARDYSAADEMEMIKAAASHPETTKKQEIWDRYL